MDNEQAKEIEHRLTETTDLAMSNKRRIDKLEERADYLEEIVITVKVLAEKMQHVERITTETRNEVKGIKEKPGQRWDAVVEKIILTIAAAFVGYIITKLGF